MSDVSMNGDDHFDMICLCAMRYALGRQTYMPGLVQDYIRAHIKEIDKNTIEAMIQDINEADYKREYTTSNGTKHTVDGLGSTIIDRPGWERFREFLKIVISDSGSF